MVFSSPIFLFLFLPVVIAVYFLAPKNMKVRNAVLLGASLLFYAWNVPAYLLIMLSAIMLSWAAGIAIDKCKGDSNKTILFIYLASVLSLLGYYKYTDFVIGNINAFCDGKLALMHVVLPIGISFYIFQSISYVVDVYRKNAIAQQNIFNLALYVSFFPQLIAGPIVKYHDIEKDINNRNISFNDIVIGTKRFIIGLGKKVLIANTMGKVADDIFNIGTANISAEVAWIGAIAYTLQIFFDFSGYSDMAIGLGRVFGFHFLENFNYPYISQSITEFWRRWHISLSTWFKEYVYIPLGGNRKGKLCTYRNLAIVFTLTGIWHGANWTFLAWGLWHGLFIVVEKLFNDTKVNIPACVKFIYTMLVVVLGWVLFRANDINFAWQYVQTMFNLVATVPQFGVRYYLTNKVILIFIVAVLCSRPWSGPSSLLKYQYDERLIAAKNLILIGILYLSAMYIAGATYNPFIYFQF